MPRFRSAFAIFILFVKYFPFSSTGSLTSSLPLNAFGSCGVLLVFT